MFLIILYLNTSSAIGFIEGFDHTLCEVVTVENDLTIGITCCTSDNLNKRCSRSQKSLFVRIEDNNETYFRKVYSLSKKVDAHQNIDLSAT